MYNPNLRLVIDEPVPMNAVDMTIHIVTSLTRLTTFPFAMMAVDTDFPCMYDSAMAVQLALLGAALGI